MSSVTLEFQDVCYQYKKNAPVLQNVSFQVKRGELVALLGVNGAGKTTALRLVWGQLSPQQGSVKLLGADPRLESTRAAIGLTPQEVDFPEGLTGAEVLDWVRAHYKAPLPSCELSQLFGLEEFLHKRAQRLSGGQKRRLALALAFAGDPQVVFLDEPTTGLDVAARKLLWEHVKAQVNKGKTVMFTTHYLEEIEHTASRVLLLGQGHILAQGSVAEVKRQASLSLTQVSFRLPAAYSLPVLHFAKKCQCETLATEGYLYWKCQTAHPDDLIKELVKLDIPFEGLGLQAETLEDAFLRLSQKAKI